MLGRVGLKTDLACFLVLTFTVAPIQSTTSGCSVTCPTNAPYASLTIDGESDQYHTVITTNNCPPYYSSDQTVCEDDQVFYVPKNPLVLSTPLQIGLFNALRLSIGVLKNGVLLYGPADTLGMDMMLYELPNLDQCMAKVDQHGVYRSRGLYVYYNGRNYVYDAEYCNLPIDDAGAHSPSMGWMWDGYEIFGRWNGEYVNIPLDDCGGHDHKVSASFSGYHYHMSLEYPYTINCFTGCPNRMNNAFLHQHCTYAAEGDPTSNPTTSPEKASGIGQIDITVWLMVILGITITYFFCICVTVTYLSSRKHDNSWRFKERPLWLSNTQIWQPSAKRIPVRISEKQHMLEQLPKKAITPDLQNWDQRQAVRYHQTVAPPDIPTYPRYRETPPSQEVTHPSYPSFQRSNLLSDLQTFKERSSLKPGHDRALAPQRQLKRHEQEGTSQGPQIRREREWTPLPMEMQVPTFDKDKREWTPLPRVLF